MKDEARNLWIEIEDAQDSDRIYLASPCKADITIEKTECDCKNYFDTDKIYGEATVQEWGCIVAIGCDRIEYRAIYNTPEDDECRDKRGDCAYYGIVAPYSVPVTFDRLDDGRYVHEFKLLDGDDNKVICI